MPNSPHHRRLRPMSRLLDLATLTTGLTCNCFKPTCNDCNNRGWALDRGASKLTPATPSPSICFALCDPVTLTFDPSTIQTISLLGYPKIIPYTKFEHFGIILFWVTLRTNTHRPPVNALLPWLSLRWMSGYFGAQPMLSLLQLWLCKLFYCIALNPVAFWDN